MASFRDFFLCVNMLFFFLYFNLLISCSGNQLSSSSSLVQGPFLWMGQEWNSWSSIKVQHQNIWSYEKGSFASRDAKKTASITFYSFPPPSSSSSSYSSSSSSPSSSSSSSSAAAPSASTASPLAAVASFSSSLVPLAAASADCSPAGLCSSAASAGTSSSPGCRRCRWQICKK